MDGDGELRLSLMATLAQEESRKVSERVKAGQKISRENKMLYGSGNILGYDRKAGESYTINPEQAETVRMIFDLYEQGLGGAKIAKVLTERGRKIHRGLFVGMYPISPVLSQMLLTKAVYVTIRAEATTT